MNESGVSEPDTITFRRCIDPVLKLDLLVHLDTTGTLKCLELDLPRLNEVREELKAGLKAGLDQILRNMQALMAEGALVRDIIPYMPQPHQDVVRVIADAQDYVLARDTRLAAFFSRGRAA